MLLKILIDIILILTLIFQLLPANKAGRSLLFDLTDDECADATCCKAKIPQIEEDYKDIHAYYSMVDIPCKSLNVSLFHFSENLPVTHPPAIPTPPPDQVV